MKLNCAIAFDSGKVLLSLADFKKRAPVFFREFEGPIEHQKDFLAKFAKNSEKINRIIKAAEKKNSCFVDNVFMELPEETAETRLVQEVVPLAAEKKIHYKDVKFIKKYLEDKFLEWDETCVHNVVINCKINGKSYDHLPLGVRAKKVDVRAMLTAVKSKVYKDAEDIFYNIDRNFGGFVVSRISMFSSVFSEKKINQAVLSLDFESCRFAVFDENDFYFYEEPEKGIGKIIEEFSGHFSLNQDLAREIYDRYVSFKEVPYFKEVAIKKQDGGYIKLSTQTINMFFREKFRSLIQYLLQKIGRTLNREVKTISFVGKLNAKEGFLVLLCRLFKNRQFHPAMVAYYTVNQDF
jgi:cell division ATPase FtsA